MFLEAAFPTPILNTSDFRFAFGGKDGKTIPTNEKGHPYHFEFVALEGMVFQVLETCSEWIVRVSHPNYPEPNLFLDRRFTRLPTSKKHPILPSARDILSRMNQMLGKPYVWGGNWNRGIPELLKFYPPKGKIDDRTKTLWTLNGVDCSGLLYEATEGATPRNTSQLFFYGIPLRISGLSLNALLAVLKPLDMILYPGHVLFVVDSTTIIESKSPFGVILRNTRDRLEEIYNERKGVDFWSRESATENLFMIRRFV